MTDGGEIESTVEEFLELEDELTDAGAGAAGTYDEGTIAGATKIPAGDVPDDYPWRITTDRALEIVVETEGGTVETFLEWPEPGQEDSDVSRLLDALGRSPDEFASIYGDRVSLAAEAGYHVVDLDAATAGATGAGSLDGAGAVERFRSLDRTLQAVVAMVGLGAATFLLAGVGATGGATSALGSLLLFVSWLGIPASMYRDLQHVREDLGWDTDATPWVAGGLVPLFNVPVGTAYLIDRYVRTVGVQPGELSSTWFYAILAGVLATFAWIPTVLVNPGVGLLALSYGFLFLPLAVYFDAEYVEDATDWNPDEEQWAIGTFLATLVGLGFLVAAAYLLRRSGAETGGA